MYIANPVGQSLEYLPFIHIPLSKLRSSVILHNFTSTTFHGTALIISINLGWGMYLNKEKSNVVGGLQEHIAVSTVRKGKGGSLAGAGYGSLQIFKFLDC